MHTGQSFKTFYTLGWIFIKNQRFISCKNSAHQPQENLENSPSDKYFKLNFAKFSI
jgi:hypothetical protein